MSMYFQANFSMALDSLPEEPMPRRERPKKVQLGTYITEDLYGLLQGYSEDSGIPITRIVEDALRAYMIARYRLGGPDAHDEDDLSLHTEEGDEVSDGRPADGGEE